jgi:hypothetical protein
VLLEVVCLWLWKARNFLHDFAFSFVVQHGSTPFGLSMASAFWIRNTDINVYRWMDGWIAAVIIVGMYDFGSEI